MRRGHNQRQHALIHINTAGLVTHSTDLALHYCVLDQTAGAHTQTHTHTHTHHSQCVNLNKTRSWSHFTPKYKYV